MKKFLSLLLAVMMIFVLFAGCNGAGQSNTDETESADQEETETAEISETAEVSEPVTVESAISSSGSPVVDSYTAFVEAKSAMVTRLTDGLSNNEATLWASMSMLGVVMVDLYLLPVAFFGLGEEAAVAGLAFFNASGVQYTENGNSYTITYSNEEGSVSSLTGVWDAAANSLVCTGSTDGVENIYSEYHKTSYGYISQYYFLNDDGTASLYIVTVQGEDGALGISATPTGKPAPLTGSEPIDYPTTLPEWYAINGMTITGVMSDGTAVDFEYVPSESASS